MRTGPLPTAAVLMLSSLADGPRHGYAIRKDIARRTDHEVRFGVTTLYRMLKQLLDAGFVEESPARPSPELDDERRRYFRITPAGRRALGAEIKRLEHILDAARRPAIVVKGRRS